MNQTRERDSREMFTTLPRPSLPPVAPAALTILLAVLAPGALTYALTKVAGPFLPATLLARFSMIAILALVLALALTRVLKTLWLALDLPGRGPEEYMPVRWWITRRATQRVAELSDELSVRPPGPDAVQALKALTRALEKRDIYTRIHGGRVSRLTYEVLARLGLPPEQCEVGRLAAVLHDIGKLGIPDSILFKPGPLDEAEYEVIKAHPTIGADLVASFTGPEVVEAVRHHHERIDGNGYPDGVRAATMALISRTIPVCDTYDTLVSDRPYQLARSKEEAFEELRTVAGSQLDSDLVEVLIEVEKSKAPLRLAAAAFLPIGPFLRRILHAVHTSTAPAAASLALATVATSFSLGAVGNVSPPTPVPRTAARSEPALPTTESAPQEEISGDVEAPTERIPRRVGSRAPAGGSQPPPGPDSPPSKGGDETSSPPCRAPTGAEIPSLPVIGCLFDHLA